MMQQTEPNISKLLESNRIKKDCYTSKYKYWNLFAKANTEMFRKNRDTSQFLKYSQFIWNTLIIPHKNTLIEIEPHLFMTKTAN